MGDGRFAQRLNDAMRMRNMGGTELAKLVGTSPTNITCYRKGKYEPKLNTIAKMAEVLCVNPVWLMGIASDPEPIELSGKDLAHNKIENYISVMDEKQINKVLKFIEDYIL